VPNLCGSFLAYFQTTRIYQGCAGGTKVSHNVPAVCDVLPARIRALRSKDQGWQNVGGVSRGNGAQRNDLGERNPGAARMGGGTHTDLLGEVPLAYYIYY
jgi:hypothetical protein